MFAAQLLVTTLFSGPPLADAELGGAYMTSISLYQGEIPTEGDGGCKTLSQPTVIMTAGTAARVSCGGQVPARSADGTDTYLSFGTEAEVSVTPAGAGLVRVVAKISSSDAVADMPAGKSPRVVEHGTARFVGIVPLGESFRFGSNEVWAAMRVQTVEERRQP